MLKLPFAVELADGVNFNPALPCAKVIKLLLAIAVVPLFWKRVPLDSHVILKFYTSATSAALRVIIRPELV